MHMRAVEEKGSVIWCWPAIGAFNEGSSLDVIPSSRFKEFSEEDLGQKIP
jgi:hypothetical protein